jgi:crossover junction endodeoxyribonuclease RuvC
MRIIGIDPGSERTGYAIIESDGSEHLAVLYGVISTSSRLPFHKRLQRIYSELTRVLARHHADAMAIEEVFYASNVQSALKLGHARGVALLVAAQHDLPVFEYSPLEIKSSIVGYGRAEKRQVQSMVRVLLSLPGDPPQDDAADALAIAICHSQNTAAPVARAAREAALPAGKRRKKTWPVPFKARRSSDEI